MLNFAILFCLALGVVSADSHARITRLVIDRVESPAFEGRSFGAAGRYEKIVGRAIGEVDPAHPGNAVIASIDKAPRNSRGMVEYEVDVYILKPVDPALGNGVLLFDVLNRGSKRLFDVFHVGAGGGDDPKRAADAGDGFLLEQGFTLLMSAWQGDVPKERDYMTAKFPIALGEGGKPLTGRIWSEFVFTRPAFSVGLGYDNGRELLPYRATEHGMRTALLTRRAGPHEPSEVVPRSQWSFAHCPDGKNAKPSDAHICMPGGFSSNWVYDLAYEAQDARILGLGFAATRDVISHLRNDTGADNPLLRQGAGRLAAHPIRHAIGFGRSQSGRFLRDFIYLGFNRDEAGRRVLDGSVSLTPGSRRTGINLPFAFPGRFSTPLEGHHAPGDQFPFTYEVREDEITGRTDGILRRCRETGTCPRIMQWDSGTEGWAARASLVVTDSLGRNEVAQPDNVRVYFFAGTQHVPAVKPGPGICQMNFNPNSYKEPARALLMHMHAWVSKGVAPPANAYPRLRDGTLVAPLPQTEFGFPGIPGFRYTGAINELHVNDYSTVPPRHLPGTQYGVLVPKVDRDGNEVAGIRSVELRVPLGTYTGWNPRRAGYVEDLQCYLNGGFIPFARSKAERGHDPRASLEERYGSHASYVARVEQAAREAMAEGFLLPQDAERLIGNARKANIGLK